MVNWDIMWPFRYPQLNLRNADLTLIFLTFVLGSSGILIPNMECKIISEDNKGNYYFIFYDNISKVKTD
jgi:hypothetical protein